MTTDIKRILVPLDFSAASRRALDQAVEVALRFDASIHLIHVCDRPAIMAAAMDGYSVSPSEWRQQLGENAEAQLADIARGVRGVRVSTAVQFGRPATVIVETAASEDADLIVMGTHGHGAMMRVVLGSVAERVVRWAPCAVLTVREPHAREFDKAFVKKLGFATTATLVAVR
jgi:nucleotide-binding universal stress UspA family protein